VANLTREEAADRSVLIASAEYDVTLDFTAEGDTFRSRSVIRFAGVPGAATFLDVVATTIHGATLNGVTLLAPAGDRIALPGLEAQNEIVVEAEHAYSNAGVGIHRFVDPENDEVFLYSQFATMYACHAFACFDQPDIKGTFEFTVVAPAHWLVVSNAKAPVPSGTGAHSALTWTFDRTVPLPTYATAVCAGPYAFVEGTITSVKGEVPARVYGRPQLLDHFAADRLIADSQAGFELYERIFDTEFPYDSYDHVYAPQYNFGAMENAGCVTVSEDRLLFRGKTSDALLEFRTVVIMHELAHMWFGDLVTMRWWDDLWLNESFAEYVGTYAAAVATEWSDAWVTFTAQRKSIAYATDQLPTTHPVLSDLPDVDSVAGAFDMITYAKGASALKQLAATLGEETFFAGIAAYLKKHAFSNATLGDLFAELEAASGRSLTAWRTAWLETPGLTTLSAEVVEEGDSITSLAVREVAPEQWPIPRPHHLSVVGLELVDGLLTESFAVAVDTEGPVTEVDALVAARRPELILPNGADLSYAKLHLDPVSLANAREHVAAIADPMNQALVLDALWHMCRDGGLPARDYVEAVLAALPGITVSAVRESHLRTVVTAVARYAPPDASQQLGTDAAEGVWAALEAAAPGSDAQLQLIQGFALLARKRGHADRLEALLGDVLHLPELAIDTDLAWDLVTGLAVAGGADDATINEYLSKDATASGERRAAGARAAIATLEAKQRAWELMAHPVGEPLANALAYETALGFARAGDARFMAPLGEAFFADVRGLFDSVDVYVGLRVVQYAYPTFLVGYGPDIVELGERWVDDNGDAHPVLMKLMVEGLDHARRAATAQAAEG